MTVQELRYFRVTCDEPGCKQYINVAATDEEHLVSVLALQKWLKVSRLSRRAFCPPHAEENQ